MTLSLRPYRPEDRAAAVHIFFRAVREGAAAFYDEAQRAAWAPGARRSPRSKASAKSCIPAFGDGYHVFTASRAHAADWSVWHLLQAFGVPSMMDRSGLGMRIE